MTMESEHAEITHETDVLVLGSGAAGCGAAMAAAEQGVRTLMVDRGLLESSGSLGGGNDHFLAIMHTDEATDSEHAIVRTFCSGASGYRPSHIREWVSVMPRMIQLLESLGIELIRNSDGSYYRTTGFGHPGAWFINIKNGQFIKRRLGRHIRQMGVEVIDHVIITRLITDGGRVTGAAGFNVLDGSFHIFRARSVVLAFGYSTGRVSTNSTGNPYNIQHYPYNTGSQYVLPYQAGAAILGLDVRQAASLCPKSFGCPGMNGIAGSGSKAVNAHGEKYMYKYHPMEEQGPRHLLSMGTHIELTEGSGPPFYMDMRHLEPSLRRRLQYHLMPGDKSTWLEYCAQRGVDFEKRPMEVELSDLDFSGLVQADDEFSSTMPGLFVGSMFGFFSGAICCGFAAGRHAARHAAQHADAPLRAGSEQMLREEKHRVFRPLHTAQGLHFRKFEDAIRQVMSYYMGFVRNEEGVKLAAQRLEYIGEHADSITARNLHELTSANESLHLLQACMLNTKATLERRESGRSAYRRSDCPDADAWYDNRILVTRQKDGQPEFSWLVWNPDLPAA